MGCICSKGLLANQYVLKNHRRDKELKSNKLSKELDGAAVGVDAGGNDATTRLITNHRTEDNAGSTPISSDEGENKIGVTKAGATAPKFPSGLNRITSITHGERGAQVVAGWPSWLTAVAGEAISGWVPRKADSFEKLDKIGQGTYSSVYRARDLESNKIVALKKVRFANMDPESVRFMSREILILRRLDHPNIMKLEGLITSRVSGSLYLVFEYMEHDLAGIASRPGIKFTEAQIKCYMQQLLRGLEHCHSHGILHRDIKGSNLLIDNYGNLKIADFGLATFYRPRQKQPLTSRVVTLWYRPPELLLGSTDYGVSVDLWSSGCILAELFHGKPIMPGRTEVEQLHKIFKLCGSPSEEYWKRSKLPHATIFKPTQPYKRCVAETFKDFPRSAMALLEVLLAVEPDRRGTASSALQSEFFTSMPLPCDPSTLPKYPPSKEFDAKLRDEEARRRRASGGKGHGGSSKESKAVPAPVGTAGQESTENQQGQHKPKSISEKYIPEEDSGSGFPLEPPKGATSNGFSHSGHSMHPSAYGSTRNLEMRGQSKNGAELRRQNSYMNGGAAQSSRFSSSASVRSDSRFGGVVETTANPHWPEERINTRYNHLDDGNSSAKHDWSLQFLNRPKSSQRKDEQPSGKDSARGYATKKNRIHYSGPLMPPGGNLEEMLKEHEKQIQHAVRKARLDKANTKKAYGENGQTESLLHNVRNGR
ncbi:probable serine/threonine-protein kinase At1g09600 [Rosa rugosa]|uniref:probable serine/threonine-protein kinase At1g09600 n=1 Tax=Rosa rugosa TaxID=74645 RepID=UPI002B401B63|nr:probable serine/threonine-protein kinase At1g09600 [Rosa rugosa]